MRTTLLFVFAVLLASASPLAAVDGVVVNRTTGAREAQAPVTLYRMGAGGMQPVESAMTDESGAFEIDADIEGPYLLQTIHGGATYNTMLSPGQPVTGLELEVYDTSADPETAHVSQHMVLIEPMGGILHVSETVILDNESNLTYNDPENGTLRLYLPPEIQNEPQARVTGPQGVPVDRSAIETSTANVYMIDYPAKPGETRFDLTYVLSSPEDGVFSGRTLHGGGPLRLVVPSGVGLSGDGLSELGQDPATGAIVYEAPTNEYTVTITGTGQISRSDSAQPSSSSGSDVTPIAARIYDRVNIVVGLGLLILLAGFLYLYRRSAA